MTIPENNGDNNVDKNEAARRLRQRNLAVLAALLAFVVLIFATTVFRMKGH